MNHKIFLLCSFSIIPFLSCKEKQNSKLEIEIFTSQGDTIQIINSLFLTNKPELLAGQSVLHFWTKWGLKTYVSSNVKCVSSNKFIIDSLATGSFTAFVTIDKNGHAYSGRIDSVLLKCGYNILRTEIHLSPIRRYFDQ